MADLAQWLTACLDEDERIARAACKYASPEWHLDEEFSETVLWWPPEFHTPYEQDRHWRGQALDGHLAPHIAEHDPARVLREVEAKRRIVEIHRVVGGFEDEDMTDLGPGCSECGHSAEYGDRGGWCETLRLLALPYADRDGYQEEWRQ